MTHQPLAYFITFHTYGTWLHGQNPGSVDKYHNEVGTPFLQANEEELEAAREAMSQDVYTLDAARRQVVCDGIIDACQYRKWELLALHIRSTHVHVVVTADCEPEFVMTCCKTNASKFLNRAKYDDPSRKRWARHGSTIYLWTEADVRSRCNYTIHRQGAMMAYYEKPSLSEAER
jgi:REP element-mobilizing transposase RayT